MGISCQNLRATAESHRNWIRKTGMLSHSGVWGAMAESVWICYVRSDSSDNMYATRRLIRQHQLRLGDHEGYRYFSLDKFRKGFGFWDFIVGLNPVRLQRWPPTYIKYKRYERVELYLHMRDMIFWYPVERQLYFHITE